MTNEVAPSVLVVGAGPVGQLAALMLSNHGIRSLLVDKRLVTSSAPKAHAVNARTLEICHGLGIDGGYLRDLGASANDAGYVRFVGTLTGPEFGALPYERQDEGAFEDTPFPLSNIPQPLFEQVLVDRIEADELVDFRRGFECVSATDQGGHVNVDLLEVDSGVRTTRRFDYVVAADGAGSSLREAQGIAMDGPESLENFLMIHFSADLRSCTEGRRGVLYFLFEPGVRGTLIAYDQASTWVLMHPWNPATEQLADYDHQRCLALIGQAVGRPVADATIENVSHWSMSAQIARQYRKGRIFLAGDAAHRFPPAGGLGLNTGAGDVQNLTWKLAAVLKGEAREALLDTYEVERQPVARSNSEQSLTNAAKIFDLFIAIHGLDPDKVAERYAQVAANPSAFPELADAVAAQKPHFDSFALQLGYRYRSAAIHDPAPVPEVVDVSDYQPSWDAGAHFPHRWIEADGRRLPLQALLPGNRFSLICGPDADAPPDVLDLNVVPAITDDSDPVAWSELTGLPSSGALLIRPDGHIAARFESVAASTVTRALDSVLARGT